MYNVIFCCKPQKRNTQYLVQMAHTYTHTLNEYFPSSGFYCERDVDECSGTNGRHGMCNERNSVLCRNFPGSFKCECKAGFLGERCEVNPLTYLQQTSRDKGTESAVTVSSPMSIYFQMKKCKIVPHIAIIDL